MCRDKGVVLTERLIQKFITLTHSIHAILWYYCFSVERMKDWRPFAFGGIASVIAECGELLY